MDALIAAEMEALADELVRPDVWIEVGTIESGRAVMVVHTPREVTR